MFVIIRYDINKDHEFIYDIVENYDTLLSYIQKLTDKYSSLKPIQSPPPNPHIGYTIPLLHDDNFEFWTQRHEFVIAPSYN